MNFIIALLLICFFSALGVLFNTRERQERENNRLRELEDSINDLLPQTQCGECEYPGCRPYAQAVALRQTEIDQCRPGGQQTVVKIANLLGRDAPEIKQIHMLEASGRVAHIDEQSCIGCVKCINACPVDAIVGAAKQMHGVITSECTGCELCLPPCPVDCISMEALPEKVGEWIWSKPLLPGHSPQ